MTPIDKEATARELEQWADAATDKSAIYAYREAARLVRESPAIEPPAVSWRSEPPTVEEVRAGRIHWWWTCTNLPVSPLNCSVMRAFLSGGAVYYRDSEGGEVPMADHPSCDRWAPCLPPGIAPAIPAPGRDALRQAEEALQGAADAMGRARDDCHAPGPAAVCSRCANLRQGEAVARAALSAIRRTLAEPVK